jgi:predicted DNA-binding transcriptional regulator AlpA
MNHRKTTLVESTSARPSRSRAAAETEGPFLPARRVWERYGVTAMTLHRWLADERMGFPAPVYIGRFRYFRLSDLLRFEAQRPRRRRAGAA